MSNTYTDAAQEMLRATAQWEAVTKGLSPEERDALLRQATEALTVTERQELAFRRKWAQKIVTEFNPYHEHSGGGQCGSCGAIQAAQFMYPEVKVFDE